MEFACGFVYVPPWTQEDSQRSNRSALLPPVINKTPKTSPKVRPRAPPPPPPTNTAKACGELQEKPTVTSANHHGPNSTTDQPLPTPRKTALLPPHVRPAASSQPPAPNSKVFTFDLPSEPNTWLSDPLNLNSITVETVSRQKRPVLAPALPPRPPFLNTEPVYLEILPDISPISCSQKSPSDVSPNKEKGPLPGNPNVVLVSLGKLLWEEQEHSIRSEPTLCPHCGSLLNPSYVNVVNECYFCESLESTGPANIQPDMMFSLNVPEAPLCPAADPLLLFCIDISGSMSISYQVDVGEDFIHRNRLEFVQEAVMLCVQRLSQQQPYIRVGLITFNNQVTVYGCDGVPSFTLGDADLIDINNIKKAGASFPTPPPLSLSKDLLQTQVMGLSEGGTTALGPAALLAVAMASRQPGSKVIICTDGKANTDLGNLEVEDDDACAPVSSTIFYQELGEYAANQGVTVSVLSIEGTDCRLDELGRLADRTRGKVVIASPNLLQQEFEDIIMNTAIATHCTLTLLLPKSLSVKGERVAGHKAIREVGNVNPDTEITFQFGANHQDKNVSAPASGSRVSVQLQIRYRQRNGQNMLRVMTAKRDVTSDSSAALSSLALAIIQLNSSQASAGLAIRGRFQDAVKEEELQRKLIERAIEHNDNAQDKEIYGNWVTTMEPFCASLEHFTRRNSVITDTDPQPLSDAGAAMLYAMKQGNRKSILVRNKDHL